ncbi:MAG: hypothetical protein ACXAB4_08485, partial [Candidatus Hodarchaeales archaeon]
MRDNRRLWNSLLTPDQRELVEISHLWWVQSPNVSKRFKKRDSFRNVLTRIILLLNLQGLKDLWQLCEITNYDRVLELEQKNKNSSSMKKICESEYWLAVFRHMVHNFTAMHYLPKTTLQQLKLCRTKVQLTNGQSLLAGLVREELHLLKLKTPKWFDKKGIVPSAVAHFIYVLNLQGPHDLKAFFIPANYLKATRLMDSKSALQDQRHANHLKRCLAEFIQPIFTRSDSTASEILTKICLDPKKIQRELFPNVKETVKSHAIRLARIRAQELSPEIEELLRRLYKNKNVRRDVHLALRYILEYGEIPNLSKLSDFEALERFYENLKQQDDVSEHNIVRILKSLSNFIQKTIDGQFPVAGVIFEKNYARATILRSGLSGFARKTRHICRDQDEVELWISTLPTWEERAVWALYAEGLRAIEPLAHEDPYEPGKRIGLRWTDFDPSNCCLRNVRRKVTVARRKKHPIIRLNEATAAVL